MRSLLYDWQLFEKSWSTDWVFGFFMAISALIFGLQAVAHQRLEAALTRGERCLGRADVACVAQAADQARALAPERPRTYLLGLGARLLLGEIEGTEAALNASNLKDGLDKQEQAARLFLVGDIEAAKGRFSTARERYQAASYLVADTTLASDRVERVRLAEREVSERRADEVRQWRADIERTIEAIEQGNLDTASLRLSELQQRAGDQRYAAASRELRLTFTALSQALSKQRQTQWSREQLPPEAPTPSTPRSASEERRFREIEEAKERERERRRQQAASAARAIQDMLTQARDFFEKAALLLDAPTPRGPQ